MRSLIVVVAAVSALSLTACGSDDSSDSSTTVAATTADTAQGALPNIVGANVDDATAALEAAGYTLRVVERDGESLAVTMDFVDNRVNVAVETQGDGSEVVTEIVSTG